MLFLNIEDRIVKQFLYSCCFGGAYQYAYGFSSFLLEIRGDPFVEGAGHAAVGRRTIREGDEREYPGATDQPDRLDGDDRWFQDRNLGGGLSSGEAERERVVLRARPSQVGESLFRAEVVPVLRAPYYMKS